MHQCMQAMCLVSILEPFPYIQLHEISFHLTKNYTSLQVGPILFYADSLKVESLFLDFCSKALNIIHFYTSWLIPLCVMYPPSSLSIPVCISKMVLIFLFPFKLSEGLYSTLQFLPGPGINIFPGCGL
jgi:hypothetical protein